MTRGIQSNMSALGVGMTDQELIVLAEGLYKTYKGNVKALDGIDLAIHKGEIFGLIGPNGAGKTTLIGCLLGLLRPDQGKVSICGKPPDFISIRKLIGYMPERPDFEYWMTARQFLLYHHGLAGLAVSEVEKDIDQTLELVELPKSAWQRRLKTYSRGMLQRLNLAQMIIAKPTIMLLDEPTLGLDPTGVAVVRKIVSEMRANGVTAIINSHQLDEIERLCDRVAFIRQGKISSIEIMRGGELADYILYVKWTAHNLDGTLAPMLAQVSQDAGAMLKEHHDRWGRFEVKDNYGAARLISELVSKGIAVEEAVPERMRLEQLFVENNGSAETEEALKA